MDLYVFSLFINNGLNHKTELALALLSNFQSQQSVPHPMSQFLLTNMVTVKMSVCSIPNWFT